MYDYFVSLGSSCVMAATMAEYGLRSWSGPFDWIVSSNFGAVLRLMDNGFLSFLELENLYRVGDNQRFFADKSCGFIFKHEGNLLEQENYRQVYEKYQRRIRRFLDRSKEKTCYLRSVKEEDGLPYIIDHAPYIRSVIKRGNNENEIVFLIAGDFTVPEEFPFRFFRIRERTTDEADDGQARDFLRFCIQNYDMRKMAKNVIFTRERKKIGQDRETGSRR